MKPLDRIDYKIVRLLRNNARLSNKELAKAVGLAPSTCLVRTRMLQQNGVLTYTINYTNNGTLGLMHVWIWDELDPAVASVISGTAVPALDPDESSAHRAAWFLGDR